MGMRTIYNHADQPIYTMYNGEIFEIPALSQVSLPDELALFFVSYYGPRGLSFEPIGAKKEVEAVRCTFCGRDFSDRDRPHQALRQHIRITHKAELSEQDLSDDTDNAGTTDN